MFENFSSNPSVATVDSSGLVSGLKKGVVTITATATYNGKTMTTTKNLTVHEVTKMNVTPRIAAVYKDYSYKKVDFNTPTYTVSPSGLSVPNPNDFTWSPSVADASSYSEGVGTQILNFTKSVYGNSVNDSYTLKVVNKEWWSDKENLNIPIPAAVTNFIANIGNVILSKATNIGGGNWQGPSVSGAVFTQYGKRINPQSQIYVTHKISGSATLNLFTLSSKPLVLGGAWPFVYIDLTFGISPSVGLEVSGQSEIQQNTYTISAPVSLGVSGTVSGNVLGGYILRVSGTAKATGTLNTSYIVTTSDSGVSGTWGDIGSPSVRVDLIGKVTSRLTSEELSYTITVYDSSQ